MVPFWNPVLESATVCPLSMSWSTRGLLWEHRKPQVKVNHRRDRSHHIHVQSLEHQETCKMRILEWSQEVDLQLLAVPSPGFSTFVILKMQVIKLSYTIPFGGRICLILSPWLFSGGWFVRWILWSLNCELWCICCLLRCITFFFYSVKKGSGLLSHFFFSSLSQLPVITTGKTCKQWVFIVKLYMGRAAYCEPAAGEDTPCQ